VNIPEAVKRPLRPVWTRVVGPVVWRWQERAAERRDRRSCRADRRRISRLSRLSPVRVILGAGDTDYPGWIRTNIDSLDVLRSDDWERYFTEGSVDALLAEHVWEHLTADEALAAARNCYTYLRNGGYFRVAVPDGLHPDPEYVRYVAPGSMGHQFLYDFRSLSETFQRAGFEVELLEWFDEQGQFHATGWSEDAGFIERSAHHDERNADGQLRITSVIIDAHKR